MGRRAPIGLGLCLLVACSGPDADTSSGAAPAWRAMAAHAGTRRVARADRALGHLDAEDRREVEAVLDRMAQYGTGADALRRAGRMAEENADIASDPEWEGSGTAPGTLALHEGALAVLLGMATASAREAPSSGTELVVTICSMRMPVRFDSGGRAPDAHERGELADAVVAELPTGTPSPTRDGQCVAR